MERFIFVPDARNTGNTEQRRDAERSKQPNYSYDRYSVTLICPAKITTLTTFSIWVPGKRFHAHQQVGSVINGLVHQLVRNRYKYLFHVKRTYTRVGHMSRSALM